MINLPNDIESLKSLVLEQDEQIRNYSDLLSYHIDRQVKAEAEVQRLNPTAQPVSDGCKVPEGWKLVPIVPTDKMINAALGIGGFTIRSAYTSMISAAPAAPGGQDA